MTLIAPVTNNTPREMIPAGTQLARLYSIVHIGTVSFEYKGEPKEANKVRLTFELPNEMRVFKEGEGEKPMVISSEFSLSMHEKANLRKFIESMVGTALNDDEARDFDVESIIGTTCLLNIVHEAKNGKEYANIQSVSPLVKGMEAPPAINEPVVLNYDDRWNEEVFRSLPEFLQKKMMETPEWKEKGMETLSDVSFAPNL